MRIQKAAFLLLLALAAGASLIPAWQYYKSPAYASSRKEKDLSSRIEECVAYAFPFRQQLLAFSDKIVLTPQRREVFPSGQAYSGRQNGVFISENGLMKNIEPPIPAYVDGNIRGIAQFAQAMRDSGRQSYIMLLPTSGAIMQRYLPRYAHSVMVNQRQFINSVYSRLSGSAASIDAYSALLAHQNSYIYYRTDDNLTALGGYYVCSAMLSRLYLGQLELNQFDIDYTDNLFYGSLYRDTGYRNVLPDSISLFRYNPSGRVPHEFLVTQREGTSVKLYHTLFPTHMRYIGSGLDVYLGGLSAVTDIYASTEHTAKLLVFGDKTAVSYLPFIANSCTRVTFADLSRAKEELESINPSDYDKIIFAYGVESFMHTDNPGKVSDLMEDWE